MNPGLFLHDLRVALRSLARALLWEIPRGWMWSLARMADARKTLDLRRFGTRPHTESVRRFGTMPTPKLTKCPIFNMVFFGAEIAIHKCGDVGIHHCVTSIRCPVRH